MFSAATVVASRISTGSEYRQMYTSTFGNSSSGSITVMLRLGRSIW